MTRDEIVDFLEWAKECGQLQFPESRKADMTEMYIKEQDAVNKTCNKPHIRNCTTCKLADAIYDENCYKCDGTYSMWEQR